MVVSSELNTVVGSTFINAQVGNFNITDDHIAEKN
jgi:hypothetical protein